MKKLGKIREFWNKYLENPIAYSIAGSIAALIIITYSIYHFIGNKEILSIVLYGLLIIVAVYICVIALCGIVIIMGKFGDHF